MDITLQSVIVQNFFTNYFRFIKKGARTVQLSGLDKETSKRILTVLHIFYLHIPIIELDRLTIELQKIK